MPIEIDRVDGLGFPEALRWRDGALWFSDMFRSRVMRWVPGSPAQTVLTESEVPGGLGWMPDGSLLVVDCNQRRVLRLQEHAVAVHADLADLFEHPANDMHVDPDGTAWVGGYGFDPERDEPRASRLARVAPDGSVSLTAAELVFPNGCERRRDGALVVAETFADRVSVLSPDAATVLRRIPLPPGSGPDGLSLAPDGMLLVALAFAGTVTNPGGELVYRAADSLACYDCAVHPDGMLVAVAVASADETHAQAEDTGSIVLLQL